MILFSSELELRLENKIKMNKFIIDVVNEKIFLMLITNKNIYNITYDNTKINYEKLTIIIDDFLKTRSLKIDDISKIYINIGPGSFAGIRNSLSIVKGIHLVKNIDYFCFSFSDFTKENIKKLNNWKNLPNLCRKYKIKKNLINPLY